MPLSERTQFLSAAAAAGQREEEGAVAERTHQVHRFEPVYDEHSKILILGTFPSVKSRENGFFYGHPRNRFWEVLALVTDSRTPRAIEEKKEFLLSHSIAVWDVIASCDIAGSSDASITNVVPADLRRILSASPVERICANGATAKRLYDRYQRKQCGREIILLPSTSPANASWTTERLAERWGQLLYPSDGASV